MISIFRDEKGIIEDEFKKDEWIIYMDIYKNLEFIVKHQKRELLDIQIDDRLLKNVCGKSKKVVYASASGNMLYSYENNETNKKFILAVAVELFDHNSIEEVFEKTSSIALSKGP